MNKHTKRFIISSFIYFLAGCTLGVVSVAMPELVTVLRPVHAHLNLLGWVSMMIIGVSYFVIPLFIGKNPYSEKALTLHFATANIGIIGMVFSFATMNYGLLPLFALIEVFSSYLFLFNIISTAIKGEAVKELPSNWDFLMGEADKEVDKWASCFTQAATLYFVIGCSLGAYMALSASGWAFLKVHFHINLLGWITMMIYGVAYHIFPRFSRRDVKNKGLVKTNFIVANSGLLFMVAALILEGSLSSGLSQMFIGISGLIAGLAGLMFVYNILPSVLSAVETMGKASVRFVLASLTYLVLGIILGLLMAFMPGLTEKIMPVHAHLNVLGWITMMIYGVGYYIIPRFAGRELHSQAIAGLQFWIANAGLLFFLILYPLGGEMRQVATLFAFLELVAAVLFIYNIGRSLLKESF
ncbi:MAG: cbb3-type cytochrome c oxidase subunit I [Deltaproteobacteria bacterium]|nr:cbb3-type cytochrome c oxidase subunit I [Deltaproteobacteria bacterium]